jgi:hypothetical protein
MWVYGWTLVVPDPTNPNTSYALNTITGETIKVDAPCSGLYGKNGPCPKPPDAPLQSFIVFRDDGKAQWFDANGNNYGELCDVSDCPPTFPVNQLGWGNTWITTWPMWMQFSDDQGGWYFGDVVQLCEKPTPTDYPPTLADAGDWIDQQDSPDDWQLDYNEDDGLYYFVNDATGETFPAQDQQPVEPEPDWSTDVDTGDDGTPDVTLPDPEYAFAGR